MDAPPVRYVKTSDGYDIAYSERGKGRPLVWLPTGFSSVETIWRHYARWMDGLIARFRVVYYDARGSGLSTREIPSVLSSAEREADLSAVVKAARLERPILFAGGPRGHDAVRYIVAYPDRVSALIWSAASAGLDAWPRPLFSQLAVENWDLFLSSLARGLSEPEQKQRVSEYRNWISPEDWPKFQSRPPQESTVEAELPRLRVPALILHAAEYLSLPQAESRKVAAAVPSARFVTTTGTTLFGDAETGLAAIDTLLDGLQDGEAVSADPSLAHLSTREVEVLRLIAFGKSNPQIADELVISLNTVQRHVSNILAKTDTENRTEAAVYAKDHGIV